MNKRKKIILAALVFGFGFGGVALGLAGCGLKKGPQPSEQKSDKSEISYYTCPMHPQIHEAHPGECPICRMTLIPVYKETSPSPTDGSIEISPERQQLIGVRTEAASKKPVSKEIRTVGRVAFDPELAVAQREYIEISQNVPSLKKSAATRLKLLGMGEEEIRSLGNRRGGSRTAPTSLYLPQKGDSVWIYATLYQDEMNEVPAGSKAAIDLPSGANQTFEGVVKSVDPVLDPMTRSVRAHIEVPKAGGLLRPDTYVNVTLKMDLGEALTIPKSAVIDTGTRKVAFVVQEGRHFQSRTLETGPDVGEDVVVRSGISEGERVVSSATFLVDSESQLKAAVTQKTAPQCPPGEAWDMGMSMCMPKI